MPIDSLWIPVTLSAAALQTVRTALQRRLAIESSEFVATYVRYVFGAPMALAALAIGAWSSGQAPTFEIKRVLLLCSAGGVFQIAGTILMLHSFRQRSYAVGTIFSKTEAIQVALLSPVLLGERISPLAWGGVLASFAGVCLLSRARNGGIPIAGLELRSTAVGISAGFLFALTSICIRGSALAVEHPWSLVQALLVLAVMTSIQCAVMTPIVLTRQITAARSAVRHARTAIWVGITSVAGSVGWFLAMALENPAKVQTVGQVEVIFAVFVSHLWFREKLTVTEGMGLAAILLGIVAVLSSR